MGFYSAKFTVPMNTPETTPYEEKLKITGGVVHQVIVGIPPGHKGYTGMAIDAGLHQIAPTNQNTWLTGDNINFAYPEYIPLPTGITEMTLRGYNTSTLHDHSFVVGVGIMPQEVYDAWMQLAKVMQPMIADIAGLAKFFSPPQSVSGGS